MSDFSRRDFGLGVAGLAGAVSLTGFAGSAASQAGKRARVVVVGGGFGGATAAKYIKAQQLRAALCREFADAMRDLDAVITLSSLLLPCRIDDPAAIAKTYDQQARLVFNVTGTPAISVPTGFSASGLPLAMQIAGRAFDEPIIFRIAQAYCEAAKTCIGDDPKSQPRIVAAKAAAE